MNHYANLELIIFSNTQKQVSEASNLKNFIIRKKISLLIKIRTNRIKIFYKIKIRESKNEEKMRKHKILNILVSI